MTLPDINDAKKAYRVAAKLRARKKSGKTLSPEQESWLVRYEAAHPSARVKPPTRDNQGDAASFMPNGAASSGIAGGAGAGDSPRPASAAPSGTSFPTGAPGAPPPIDLSGAAAPASPTMGSAPAGPAATTQSAADHEKNCEELARQFVAGLHLMGEKIKEAGGVGLSPMVLDGMVGPSAKRLLMRYLPVGGETSHYLDIGVVGGSVAYLGYQGYMVVKRKKDDAKEAAILAATMAKPTPVVKDRTAPPQHVPVDVLNNPAPIPRIDPQAMADAEDMPRKKGSSEGYGALDA